MDLKVYYQKLREIESGILEAHPVVVSNETPDGGKAGVRTEVTRGVAARLILAGKARLASEEEAAEFRSSAAAAHNPAEQAVAASRLPLSVIPESELQMLRRALSAARENRQEK